MKPGRRKRRPGPATDPAQGRPHVRERQRQRARGCRDPAGRPPPLPDGRGARRRRHLGRERTGPPGTRRGPRRDHLRERALLREERRRRPDRGLQQLAGQGARHLRRAAAALAVDRGAPGARPAARPAQRHARRVHAGRDLDRRVRGRRLGAAARLPHRRQGPGPVLPGRHQGLHLAGQADRAALVHRQRDALLPHRPAREGRRQGARDLGRAGRDRAEAPGIGGRQVRLPLAGQAGRGPGLRPGRDHRLERRLDPRARRQAGADRRRQGGRGRAVHARHHRQAEDQPGRRAELGRGAVAPALHRRRGGLPAQLVLRLGRGPGPGPVFGRRQGRRGAPAPLRRRLERGLPRRLPARRQRRHQEPGRGGRLRGLDVLARRRSSRSPRSRAWRRRVRT